MTKIVVYHEGRGCATGCCGHAIYVNGAEEREAFEQDHPRATGRRKRATPAELRQFAEQLVTQELGSDHVADLDWENCLVLDWRDCPVWGGD